MIKVAINTCFGGFYLSEKASNMFNKLKGLTKKDAEYIDPENGLLNVTHRHDKVLVKIIEELGEEAGGDCSSLEVIELPGNLYRIEEYDGKEELIKPEGPFIWTVVQDA